MRLPFQRMGLILPACLVGCFASGQPANQPANQPSLEPRLRGIVHWNGLNRALIELAGRAGRPILTTVRAGERISSYQVLSIDETNGRVQLLQLRPRQTNELRLAMAPDERRAGRTFAVEGARLSQILEVYQDICGRTVLAPSGLPEVAFDLKSGPNLSAADATEMLDQKLAARGIFPVLRGDKFVFVVPQQRLHLPDAARDPPAPDARAKTELLPAGLIRFRDADTSQVLQIYSELTGRVVLHPGLLRGKPVTVRSQTPLTRPEAAWLLENMLLLSEVAVVPESDRFAFAVPASRTEPLPKFKPRALGEGRAGSIDLGSMTFVDATGEKLLEAYAGLLRRRPVPVASDVPAVRVSFQTRQPLDRGEALFALEALAALNQLKFELVGDRQVKLVPAPVVPQ